MNGAPPIIGVVSRPFWDALARGGIAMQRCDACMAWIFYPRHFCPYCGGRELSWTQVTGPAHLYSWTIAHVPVAKAFAHLDRPVLCVAELSNGVRLPSTLVDPRPETLKIGMAIEPVFDAETYDGVTLLRFRALE